MKLLSPVQVGSLEIRNRVVSTAHGSFLEFYRPGSDRDRYIAYQERRARGGAGLIILQPVHVHRSSHALGHYPYEPDDLRERLTAMAAAVHRHGARVFQQLIHFGGQFRSDGRQAFEPLWAFDDLVTAEGEAAHRMTTAEVEEVLEAFVATAETALEAGLDGVELHGTHGYLIQQSFSPWGNHRDDEWGDPLAFATALVERLRARVGREPVVGLRISTEDFLPPERGGLGADGLQARGGRARRDGRPRLRQPVGGLAHGPLRPHDRQLPAPAGRVPAARARAAGRARRPRVPVIAASRINDPAQAEAALQAGDCDLVAMTRAQIADPDLVAKVRAGRRIRHCVAANQGCVDRMIAGAADHLLPQPRRRP